MNRLLRAVTGFMRFAPNGALYLPLKRLDMSHVCVAIAPIQSRVDTIAIPREGMPSNENPAHYRVMLSYIHSRGM